MWGGCTDMGSAENNAYPASAKQTGSAENPSRSRLIGTKPRRPTHNFTAGQRVDLMVCFIVSDVWFHISLLMLMVLADLRFLGFYLFSEFFCGFYCCSIFEHLYGFHCVFVPSHFYVTSSLVFLCLLILLLLGYIVDASMYSQAKIKTEWMNGIHARSYELQLQASIRHSVLIISEVCHGLWKDSYKCTLL